MIKFFTVEYEMNGEVYTAMFHGTQSMAEDIADYLQGEIVSSREAEDE